MRRTKSLIQLVFYYWLALTTYAGEANYTTNNNYTNGINYANTSLRFTHYDNDDGLSQNSAYAIVKDKHGFIWIGTQDGLNRFDGYQFKQFKHDSSNPYSISGSYILSLFIDESGELWIGTFNGGLNHFDYATERFTSYQHDAENSSSISSNRISSITQLNSKELLIGTLGGGLNRFNKSRRSFAQLNNDSRLKKVRAVTINTSEDNEKELWVGTENYGLFKLSSTGEILASWSHSADDRASLSNDNVLSLLFDASKTLWVGTNRGLNRLSSNQDAFTRYLSRQASNPDSAQSGSISDNVVRALLEDNENKLWIGTNSGIQLLDENREVFTTINHDPTDKDSLNGQVVSTLYLSTDNILWIGMFTVGVDKLDLATKQFHHYKHNSNNPYSISQGAIWNFADAKNGNFWVATDGGVNYFDHQSKRFTTYQKEAGNPNSLSSNLVWTIVEESPGVAWAGTFDGGLNHIDTVNETVTHYLHDNDDPASLSHNHVASLLIDHKHNLWLGTFAGLDFFNRESQQFEHYQHDPNDPTSIAPHWIANIFEDRQHFIWLAHAGGGISRFDPVSKEFSHFRHDPNNPNSIASDIIANLLEDHKGNIWVATYGGGISRISKDYSTITTYTMEDGLVSNATLAIVESEPGILWISSNNGLSRFDVEKETFLNYKVEDGLQDNEFNSNAAFKTDKGELFFGGINGFNRFHPDKVFKKERDLAVKLTQVRVTNVPVAITPTTDATKPANFSLSRSPYLLDELEITHNENLISFEFSALNFENPDAIEYQYKLSNFDNQWITTDHSLRRATYTNIPAGKYQLQVRAKLPRDQWRNNAMTLNISVRPAPWRSWWAYSIYAIIVFTIVGSFALQRYHKFVALKASKERLQKAQDQLSQLNNELEHRVAERTAELRDTLEELRSTQRQLIESEKMSSLADLLVGIAHELNTPMGVAITSSTLIQEAFDSINEKTSQGKVRMTDFEQFQSSTRQGMSLLVSSLNKTIDLIQTFKALSPKSDNEPTTTFNLFETLQHLSQESRHQRDGIEANITINCPKDLELDTYISDFIEVIQQLIDNACHHAFENIDNPTINIVVTSDDDHINLLFSDNGAGINAEKLEKILEPFYTSQRGSSRTGLGLAIVYNKVYYRLNGEVSFASEIGQGLEVKISLPIHKN